MVKMFVRRVLKGPQDIVVVVNKLDIVTECDRGLCREP